MALFLDKMLFSFLTQMDGVFKRDFVGLLADRDECLRVYDELDASINVFSAVRDQKLPDAAYVGYVIHQIEQEHHVQVASNLRTFELVTVGDLPSICEDVTEESEVLVRKLLHAICFAVKPYFTTSTDDIRPIVEFFSEDPAIAVSACILRYFDTFCVDYIKLAVDILNKCPWLPMNWVTLKPGYDMDRIYKTLFTHEGLNLYPSPILEELSNIMARDGLVHVVQAVENMCHSGSIQEYYSNKQYVSSACAQSMFRTFAESFGVADYRFSITTNDVMFEVCKFAVEPTPTNLFAVVNAYAWHGVPCTWNPEIDLQKIKERFVGRQYTYIEGAIRSILS